MTSGKIPIAVAEGDGIGPEILAAVLHILDESGANLEYHPVILGEKPVISGFDDGIEPSTWDVLKNTASLLKGPTSVSRGISATISSTLGFYANICPCISYAPFIPTHHPKMSVILIHENEKAVLEYRQTPETYEIVKIISQPETERIIRLGFEYARNHGRGKVACLTKNNSQKLSKGLFHRVFDEIATEYSDIASEHWLCTVAAADLVSSPGYFDVILLPNPYGEILAPLAAELTGAPALVPSANIGEQGGLFEALHGPSIKLTGQNAANPSGLLLSAVMLLDYLGLNTLSERIQHAWLKTIEEGFHTQDIYNEGISKRLVGTKEFATAVVKLLGQKPTRLKAISYKSSEKIKALDLRLNKKAKEFP